MLKTVSTRRLSMSSLLATAAEVQCWLAILAFTLVATASRNERVEMAFQRFIMGVCLTLAATFIALWFNDENMWGKADPRPLAVVCVIIAIAARLNLKGENVSFGANPHTINKREEE
jgi:hypothetical protein